MRCRTCDYPLWNLTTRQCPECGRAFTPAEFEFVPSSVRFCCPHCDQPYYGTDENGLLEPREFTCVTCGRGVSMDEMVLRPAEGLHEKQTRVEVNPWLDRAGRRPAKRWLGTVGQALVAPFALARATPAESSLRQAWWFLLVTQALTILGAFAPALVVLAVLPLLFGGAAGAPGPAAISLTFIAVFAVTMVAGLLFEMAYAGLWMLAAHGLLRMTGTTAGTLRVTCQAICYSSGANLMTAVPCAGQYIGMLWWLVSAVLMVKEGQRVSGARAAFAVVSFPVALIVAIVALYVAMIGVMIASSGAATAATNRVATIRELATVNAALLAWAQDRPGGGGPPHAITLVLDDRLTEWDVVGWRTATGLSDVPVAGDDLAGFAGLAEDLRAAAAGRAAASLPADVVAHRLGDFVFTYHGIPFETGDPGLWIVVYCPDPDVNGPFDPASPAGTVAVGQLDGRVLAVPPRQLGAWLAAQNTRRAAAGLPPLPDPTAVTHDEAATAPPETD